MKTPIIGTMRTARIVCLLPVGVLAWAVSSGSMPSPQPPAFDVVIRGGMVYDGTGAAGRRADVGLRGDHIAGVGDLQGATATTVVNADGRSQGELREGVTTQIMGEGDSMGPLTPEMKKRRVEMMGDIKYDITWTTLAEYLKDLERRGVAQNVASFVGATTIREHVI